MRQSGVPLVGFREANLKQKLEYTVSERLWNEPDSPASKGYKASKGFIDCMQWRLPSPF